MADDARSYEELKAEQDAWWARAAETPVPEGYADWARAQIEEAIRECEQPGAVFYTEDEVNAFMQQRRTQHDAGLLKRAS